MACHAATSSRATSVARCNVLYFNVMYCNVTSCCRFFKSDVGREAREEEEEDHRSRPRETRTKGAWGGSSFKRHGPNRPAPAAARRAPNSRPRRLASPRVTAATTQGRDATRRDATRRDAARTGGAARRRAGHARAPGAAREYPVAARADRRARAPLRGNVR